MQAAKGEKTKIQVPLQDGTTKTVELGIPAGASRPQRPRTRTLALHSAPDAPQRSISFCVSLL